MSSNLEICFRRLYFDVELDDFVGWDGFVWVKISVAIS
jgi:hypothetical protein